MNSRDPRYWAFISYSHRDERVASKLLRSLEAYLLPAVRQGVQPAVC